MRRILPILSLSIVTLISMGCGSSGPDTPNPEISGIQPDHGPPGTMITISGSGFHPELTENSVTLNNLNLILESGTETELQVTVPEEAASGPIVVNVGDERAVGPEFTVEEAAPGISSVEPDSGTIGTEVTISGMNFSTTASENMVTFGGIEAPVNNAAEDALQTEVPEGADDGPVEVTVDGETAIGPDFDVVTEGTLEVIIKTNGSDKDEDGYELTVKARDNNISRSVAVDISDTAYVSDLEEGVYDVELSGLARNCSVEQNNPHDKSIAIADTSSTDFTVSCAESAFNKIVFYERTSGNLFIMDDDGSNRQQLTDNQYYEANPAFSHLGHKIAFSQTHSSNAFLYIMDADGANKERITHTGSTGSPSWSPDDSKIVVSYNHDIYVIDVDDGNKTQLTDNSDEDRRPSWSPDGDKIAFQSNRDGDTEIYTMNTDGSKQMKITDNVHRDESPGWSPDGSKLAFFSDRDGDGEIYTMDPDGANVRQITNNSDWEYDPAWSPDGSRIIFVSDRDFNDEIYKISADGSGTAINLTNSNADELAPFWSPME